VIKIGVPPTRDCKETLFVPHLINPMAPMAMNPEIVASLLLSSALSSAAPQLVASLPSPSSTAAAVNNNNNILNDDDNNNNNNYDNNNNNNNISAVSPVVIAPHLLGNLIAPLAEHKLAANNDLGGSLTPAMQLE
jgi:hypothetical protein